jgi:glycosyltransferase involved in cell wall biosynthesis
MLEKLKRESLMKILMLGWELPPYNSGGLGVASHGLAKGLASHGHKIDFILPYQSKHPDSNFMQIVGALPYEAEYLQLSGAAYDSEWFEEYSKLKFQPIPNNLDLSSQRKIYAKFVANFVQDHDYDVIHAHEWLTLEAGMIAKQTTGKPLIAHVHATEYARSGEHHGNPFVHEIEEQGLMLADHIIAVSQHTKNVIVNNYHIPADKIEVIHNAINPEDFHTPSLTSKYEYISQMKQRGYKVVVNVGRLTTQKGLSYLLKAFVEVKRLQPKSLLLIVGGGELFHELIALSAELGIADSVLFTGFQRGQALRQAYAIGDVFVMPSVSEPFGITPLEAASFNLPVIISKTSGVGEVLRSSFKVDYWDTLTIADRIVNLLKYDSLSREISSNAYQEFAHLSWKEVAEKCERLYNKVTSRPVGVWQ